MSAARRLNLEILISFEHSRGDTTRECFPTVSQYYHATNAFRERYPDVKVFTAWNEPHHTDQPTRTHLVQAGRYWRNLNWQCKSKCVVAAGDFLDANFKRDYLADYKIGVGHNPRIWAWHAYQAGRLRSTAKLRAFLNSTRSTSQVWLTEQGAVYDQANDGKPPLSDTEAQARLRYIMTDVPRASKRITRLYVYQWSGDQRFDAGLIDYRTGQRRYLYTIVKNRTNP